MNPLKTFKRGNVILEIVFVLTAIIAGFNFQINYFAHKWNPEQFQTLKELANSYGALKSMIWRPALGIIITPLLFYALRILVRFILSKINAFKNNIEKYTAYDAVAFLPFLFTCSGYWGININYFLIFSLFIIIQSYLIYKVYAENNQVDMNTEHIKNNRLFVLFFVSGFAALIYQVVWQRALFRFFGVNIESVTVIVSIFMLGLGLGALIGGYLSKKFPGKLPHLFVICEASIGIFGFFSLKLFAFLTEVTLHSSPLTVALTIYGVLIFPTLCMGATLPILIEYFHKTIKQVGKTVSILYFINTLGSALASFFTVEVLFLYFGMQFSAVFASVCNLLVALLGALFIKSAAPNTNELEIASSATDADTTRNNKLRFFFILLLACITGYIAMSQEILWIRFLSFATAGKADVFAKLVGFILVGIAFGSVAASWICKHYKNRLMAVVAMCMIIASFIYFMSIPVLSRLITKIDKDYVILLMYLTSGFIAFLMGITLPLLAEHAVRSYKNVGMSVSWIYFANILGSTIGPIFTGFFLLEWINFEKNVLILSIATWILGVILWVLNINSFSPKKIYKPILVILTFVVFFYYPKFYKGIFERLYLKEEYNWQPFKYEVQNKSGVITVLEGGIYGDIILGGGIFDGRFNTSLKTSLNGIERAYMFAALRPNSADVLEIGLSSGSWSRVMANYKDVKSLDIVEINPGYADIVAKYPEQASLLKDERVKIHYDDGRRWLSKTDKKFDFILMNTSFYWRSQANNLLSKEFIELCKSRLKEGGVVYYNSTYSPDVPYTTAHVFKYVTRYFSFVAGSDSPFPTDSMVKRESLKKFYQNGLPVFDEKDSIMLGFLNELSSHDLSNLHDKIVSDTTRYLITDDNLASEFKTQPRPIDKRRAWTLLFHE